MSAKSAKKWFARNKTRPMEEIQKNYQELCAKAGNLEAQVRFFKKEIEETHKQIERLADEAGRRKATSESKAQTASALTPTVTPEQMQSAQKEAAELNKAGA